MVLFSCTLFIFPRRHWSLQPLTVSWPSCLHMDLRRQPRNAEGALLAARENWSEDEIPEELLEVEVGTEGCYQESTSEWRWKPILTLFLLKWLLVAQEAKSIDLKTRRSQTQRTSRRRNYTCCTPLQKRKKRGKAKQNPFPRSSYLQGSCSQWRIPALSPFVAFGVRERSHSKATIVFVSNCFFTARFAVLLVNYFTFSSREMQPYS